MKWVFYVLVYVPLISYCQLNNYEMYMPSSTDNLVYHKSFYSHSYLEDNKLSEWTIYFTSNDMEFGKYLRTNDFRSDGILDYDYSARLSDYRGSGYDRGHLVPAADMNFDSIALSETFLMSNISPQSPSFNRGINKALESLVRCWREKYDSLIIITGCLFKDTAHFQKTTIGSGIPIPEFYYKIIVDIERSSSIAFVMPNTKGEYNLESYVYSIDEVEKLTGINFLYKLPLKYQNLIEKEVHLDDWSTSDCVTSFYIKPKKNKISKMALVIGNSDYHRVSDKLKNPINDANLIYNTFIDMGFDTLILLEDQNHKEMKNAIRNFQDLSSNYDLNIFYFAGHGIQDKNGNSYLVPTDYNGDNLEEIAVSLRDLIKYLSLNDNNKSILVLDACRETFDSRSMSKPNVEDPVNLKLGFSTSYGKLAFDHPELNNSLYTSVLANSLLTPNITLNTIFQTTWNKVYNSTHHKQSPTVYFGQELEELILLY